jgi:GDP-L-fucose synthase
VLVAGAATILGLALTRVLAGMRTVTLVGNDLGQAVLADMSELERAFRRLEPTHVIVAAGHSGGIGANRRVPADLMLDNLRVITAVLPAAHACGITSLLYVASSCVYPRESAQPMAPDTIWSGRLEPTSEAYATAKLSGLVLTQAYRDQHRTGFITGIAGDSYGPGGDFDAENAHVVHGLIRRMHDARERRDAACTVWGSGQQVRDFVYVDDLAVACLIALARYDERQPINLSTGTGTSIRDLANTVSEVVGYSGALVYDRTRPDGTPVKVLDSAAIRRLGFTPRTTLRTGIERTYEWFLEHVASRAI